MPVGWTRGLVLAPNRTVVWSVTKPDPSMATFSPPTVEPIDGSTVVAVGGGT